MEVQVNWVAVVLAAVAAMAVGMVWYAKPVFGNMWIKLAKIDESKMKSGSTSAIVMSGVATLFMSFVLAHLSFLSNRFYGNSFLNDALNTAFWVGLGVACTTLVINYAFEQRPKQLVWLNVAHQFVSFMVMGLVIGLLRP